MFWLVTIGGALLICGLASYTLARNRGRWSILDQVNPRSLHVVPVPRTGGVALLLGILFAAALVVWGENSALPMLSLLLIIFAFAIVGGISLLDDIRSLGVVSRLAGQLVAALLLMAAGLYVNDFAFGNWSFQPGTVTGVVVGILFTVWLINLYNFMDGMDGLAAGMGVFGFGTFALLGVSAGHIGFAQFNGGIAAACFGFLLLNFPPARIFMGDLGSTSLGFLAALMSLWANREGVFPLWVGLVVFSPFVVDATWTLARRLLHCNRPWQAHRDHFYQRLVLGGWSQRKVLGGEYGLMAICALFALALECSDAVAVKCALLGGLAVIYLGLIVLVNLQEAGCNGRPAA